VRHSRFRRRFHSRADSPDERRSRPTASPKYLTRLRPHTVAGGLFLGDRMFFNKPSLASIEAEGGFFVVKAKGTLNPTIRRAYPPRGARANATATHRSRP
jgi:hypothetical protein